MAQSSSIFITAADARQNSPREIIVHDEAREIESQILQSVKLGLFEAIVENGTEMTNSSVSPIDVWSVDTMTNQLYIPAHEFSSGDAVTVNSTVSLPSPLSSIAYYYVIYIDNDHIKLADSYSNAILGRPISVDISLGVNTIQVTDNGSGYIYSPAVSFTGGNPTSVATAKAVLSTWGNVLTISNSTTGSNYVDQPTMQINSVGEGAVAGIVSYQVVGMSISSAGLSYTVGDIISVAGGTGTITASATVIEIDYSGAILAISLRNPGKYTVLPTLAGVATTVLPTGGSAATLNLTMGIVSISVNATGFGYIQRPRVILHDPSGSGAIITAIVQGGGIASFIIDSPGYGYVGVSSIDIDSGNGAAAIPILQPTTLKSVLVRDGGNGYTSIPDVSITTHGSGASIDSILLTVVSAQLSFLGFGYSKDDTLLIAGGIAISDAYLRVISVDSNGSILTFSLESGGSYSTLPVLDFNLVIGGTGSSASFNLSVGVGSISVNLSGSGYIVPPVMTIDPPTITGGVQAKFQAILTLDAVTQFRSINSGSGYNVVPSATLSNGSGAVVIANLTATVVSDITVDAVGSGYTTANVTIVGGGASVAATASANISGGEIISIDLIDPGVGYIDQPIAVIDGDGIDATATVNLVPTNIDSFSLTNIGSGYNYPPTITVNPGPALGVALLTETGIDHVLVTNRGQNYTSIPIVYVIPGTNQAGTPTSPIMSVSLGYSVAYISITSSGTDYSSVPTVTLSDPNISDGSTATATATIGAGSGTFVLMPYHSSRDYFKAWKGQQLSNTQWTRPYAERMDTVIAYFTNLGYNINRITNTDTNNTLVWKVVW